MEFSELDKLNIPLLVCGSDLTIEYKNRSAKLYFRSPRCKMNLSRYKAGNDDLNSGKNICVFNIEGNFKRALRFDYYDKTVFMFVKILQFETLSYDLESLEKYNISELFTPVLDAFTLQSGRFVQKDKYMFLDKAENSILSALSLMYSERFSNKENEYFLSVKEVYDFLKEKTVSYLSKSGYKVQIDCDDLDLGYDLFTDGKRLSCILSRFISLALCLSDDKKCTLKATAYSKKMRNVLSFSAKGIENTSGNGLEFFKEHSPYGYINILPAGYSCTKLGWNIMYEFNNSNELNGKIILDVDIRDIFGKTVSYYTSDTKEKSFSDMEKIIADALFIF